YPGSDKPAKPSLISPVAKLSSHAGSLAQKPELRDRRLFPPPPLPWRPVHRTPAKQVDVKVVDCLTTVWPGVDDGAKSIPQPFVAGDTCSNRGKNPKHPLIFVV